MTNRKTYLRRLLLAFDQFANVLFSPLLNLILGLSTGGHPPAWFGDEDETLSSVFGKNRRVCEACYWVCRALSLLDPGHCQHSIEKDEGQQ